MALNVKEDNFDTEILNSSKPVLADFWASWCGPCQMLAPVIDELSEETDKIKICKINVDEQPVLAARYNVMSVPTLIVFKDGEEITRGIGFKSKTEIMEMLKGCME